MKRYTATVSNDKLKITLDNQEEHFIYDVESFGQFAAKVKSGEIDWYNDDTRITCSSSINWASDETENQFVIDIIEYIFHDGDRPVVLGK